MESRTVCKKCGKTIIVSGPGTNGKMVYEVVTCKDCGEPNEIEWPMGAGWTSVKCE
jgi:RNase P subunit RPR2